MAKLAGGKVIVSGDFEPIGEQGFGELKNGKLELAPFEALYLLEKKRLEVSKGKKPLPFDSLMKELKRKDKHLGDVYAVFRDLRAAGYVARDGKAKTPCLRVYARGARPEEEPARYLVWVIDPKGKLSEKNLREMVGRAHAVRKRAVFASVGKDTITYFKIDTTKF